MPRVSAPRTPAQPVSAEQQERYRRILRAAIEQGSVKPLDRVQMHEVAMAAGVAIATLYRYFPSKTELFTAVVMEDLTRLERRVESLPVREDPAEAVAECLVIAGDNMLARPLLAQAMLHANNSAAASREHRVGEPFRALLLRAAGVSEPSDLDRRLMRLVEQSWFGILTSAINGHITLAEAQGDTRLACQRLLVGLGQGA